jgi:hypothetical protein
VTDGEIDEEEGCLVIARKQQDADGESREATPSRRRLLMAEPGAPMAANQVHQMMAAGSWTADSVAPL